MMQFPPFYPFYPNNLYGFGHKKADLLINKLKGGACHEGNHIQYL